ncbi:metalloregulator ArsR/SmtB family transcription factor [Streptomyces sp. NPDC052687]|uniref:metalloregulator ArsR/SmtB family transcription factor n=1 Tax=Streptomyces sp. NPDC052687 TaxID=3154759 RepID=UPI0034170EE2
MERIAAALGDSARWRLVELLAERPRSVGELAELTGLRQPQTTKHLQTLARAGLVSVFPLGQRRVYAAEAAPLAALGGRLRELAGAIEAQGGDRDVLARYRAAVEADSAVADRKGWADGRGFTFERVLAAPRDVVWRHWVDPDLLASWWAPPPMTVTDCLLEPRPGGRALLDYRDAEGRYHSEGRVHAAEDGKRLVFDLAVGAADSVSFTGHYNLTLADAEDGTRLRLGLRITGTAVDAVPFVAGIETGWGRVLDNLADAVGSFRRTTTAHTERREAQS